MNRTLFIDPGRCIGCQACVAACRECDSHRGKSMIHLDYLEEGATAASMPTVCMHCEDPVAPCAQVCPTDAILVTTDGVVQDFFWLRVLHPSMQQEIRANASKMKRRTRSVSNSEQSRKK